MSLYSDVRTLIGEVTTPVYFTLAHVCDAINEAILGVYTKTRHKSTSTTITFGVGASVVAIPTSIMIPQKLEYNSKSWFPTTFARLEQHNQYWREASAAQPRWVVLRDWNHLQCWPDPDTTYTFTIYGCPYPAEIDGSAVVDISDSSQIKNAIMYRAAASLVEHDFPQSADYFRVESERNLLDFNISNRNKQSHNIRRLRPGVLFTNAQSGSIKLGQRMGL